MKCKFCEVEGKTSILHHMGSSHTLLGGREHFFDKEGNEHYHDLNTITTYFKCSNGHEYNEKEEIKCPTCGVRRFP